MVEYTYSGEVWHTHSFSLISCFSPSCFSLCALHSNASELSCSFSQTQISVEWSDGHNRKITEGDQKIPVRRRWNFLVQTNVFMSV